MRLISLFLLVSYTFGVVQSQDSTTGSGQGAVSPSLTASALTFTDIQTTVTTTIQAANTRSRGTATTLTTVLRSSYSLSQSPTTTTVSAPSATQSSQEPERVHLHTKIDPAFGILGALLILTGLPSAFWGHKNRWTSFFLIGFYTLSLICFVLIARFGILQAVNPPSKVVRGLFLLACAVAGVAGGGISIFFWQQTKYFIGAWGGLAFSWWIQCLHNGGLIRPIGFRWLFYIICAVIGFVLCTFPKVHYHILLVSTAAVGATAFVLGVDCFTTAGLKEFYVHNLGFRELFPKFAYIDFPVTQTMQIEIGLIGAVALMGAAVQLRILVLLQAKLREIGEDQRRREAEIDARVSRRYQAVDKDLEAWEKEHGNGRVRDSMGGDTPILAESGAEGRASSQLSFLGIGKSRQQSLGQDSLPKLLHTPPVDERPQSVILPTLDLGNPKEDDLGGGLTLPEDEMASSSVEDDPELKEKLKLLREIRAVRKNIDALRNNSNESSSSSRMSRPLSTILTSSDPAPPPAHLRPPRETNPATRERVHSLDAYQLLGPMKSGESRDAAWDAYLSERKLFTPPSGVTPPIQPSVSSPLPPAVEEALAKRKAMEAVYEHEGKEAYLQAVVEGAQDPRKDRASNERPPLNWMNTSGSGTKKHHTPPPPLSPQRPAHSRSKSSGAPIVILPPTRTSAEIRQSPTAEELPPRIYTYGELTERHRSKIRELQEPLTKAEDERAKLNAAKSRWEKSLAVEKLVMERRETDALADKKARRKAGNLRDDSDDDEDIPLADKRHAHSRSHSRGKLPVEEGPSKRHSVSNKVQEWQKHQAQHARRHSTSPTPAAGPSQRRSSGRAEDFIASAPVPFPARTLPMSSTDPAILDHRRRSSGRSLADRWNQYSPNTGGTRPPN